MNPELRRDLIARYKDGYRVVSEALAGATEAELDARPAPGAVGWRAWALVPVVLLALAVALVVSQGDRVVELVGAVERRVQGPFVEIATGYGTDCARRADGTAVCWAGTADALELDGTFTTIGAGERVQALRTDGTVVDIAGSVVTVPVDGTFVELAVGGDFACGLDEDGHVRCWGSRAR